MVPLAVLLLFLLLACDALLEARSLARLISSRFSLSSRSERRALATCSGESWTKARKRKGGGEFNICRVYTTTTHIGGRGVGSRFSAGRGSGSWRDHNCLDVRGGGVFPPFPPFPTYDNTSFPHQRRVICCFIKNRPKMGFERLFWLFLPIALPGGMPLSCIWWRACPLGRSSALPSLPPSVPSSPPGRGLPQPAGGPSRRGRTDGRSGRPGKRRVLLSVVVLTKLVILGLPLNHCIV